MMSLEFLMTWMTWQQRQTYKHLFMTSNHHLMNTYTLLLFFAAFWASVAGVNGNRRVLGMDVWCNLSPLSDILARASACMWFGWLCPGNLLRMLTSWSVGSTLYLRGVELKYIGLDLIFLIKNLRDNTSHCSVILNSGKVKVCWKFDYRGTLK